MNFRHAGELGDIVYSLPVIRHLGGGVLYIEAADYTRRRFTPEVYAPIVPLLKAQPYIEDVREWKGEPCDVNLNDMRALAFREMKMNYSNASRVGLWQWYAKAFEVPEMEWSNPWIAVANPMCRWTDFAVIAHRGSNYHNPRFPWSMVLEKFSNDHLYAFGVEGERENISRQTHFVIPRDILYLARCISGARLFIGNQSVGYAIAEALKKPAVLEVWPNWPNCLFNRPYLWHGFDETVYLPSLEELP